LVLASFKGKCTSLTWNQLDRFPALLLYILLMRERESNMSSARLQVSCPEFSCANLFGLIACHIILYVMQIFSKCFAHYFQALRLCLLH
jgi:hypothetical protein